MNIAEHVAGIARASAACTFYGGYAQMPNGRRVQFPQGVQAAEARNAEGRCTFARYIYADGSRLTFRWSRATGSRITTEGARC